MCFEIIGYLSYWDTRKRKRWNNNKSRGNMDAPTTHADKDDGNTAKKGHSLHGMRRKNVGSLSFADMGGNGEIQ